MAFLSATKLLLALSLAAGVTHAAESTCQNAIYCPCGNSSTHVLLCSERENTENDPCRKWSNCKSCREGVNECLQCEDGFEGPLCTIPKSQEAKSRQRRQLFYRVLNRPTQWQGGNSQRLTGSCTNLDSPKLGSIRCVSSDQRRTCVGRCLPGYNFENYETEEEITLNCRGGIWTPLSEFPPCKSGGHCDMIVQGAGSFNCTTGMTGTRCDVTCVNQYRGRYYCFPGRIWDPPLPSCVRPKEVVEVRPTCRCQNGGYCDSRGQCVCPADRTGIFCEIAVVSRQTCTDPGFVQNAIRRHVDGSESSGRRSFEEGESVVYNCRNDDFALHGSSLLRCKSDGTWSSPLPRCIKPTVTPAILCPDPGQVAHATRLSSDGSPTVGVEQYRVGQSVVYTCDSGFALQRRSLITCQSSGRWSSRTPYCSRITPPSPVILTTTTESPSAILRYCRDIGVDPNGSRQPRRPPNPRGFLPGSQVEFSCNQGYDLRGEYVLFCFISGEWSAGRPRCQPQSRAPETTDDDEVAYCLNPGPISNGQVVYYPSINDLRRGHPEPDNQDAEIPEGSRLQYSCNSGYSLDGASALICQNSGFWSAAVPKCKRVTNSNGMFCGNPGIIFNGRIRIISNVAGPGRLSEDDEEYPEGTQLQYTCDDGYVLQGSYRLRCQSSSFWSADPPTCVSDCGRSFMQTSHRILHGDKTVAGEFPWVVSIQVQENNFTRFICGGAVLNSRTIITAAHCLVVAKRFNLYFGKLHMENQKDDIEVLVRRSTRIMTHPDFNQSNLDSDIGLLMFEPKIRFSKRVQPICLPTAESTAKNIMTGKLGFVTGWGETERQLPADDLLLAKLPVLTNDACMRSYMNQNINLSVSRNMFCAGFENGQQSVCSGDSGSPLVFYDNLAAKFTIEGLVSFGVQGQCGLPGRYSVFTKVFQFLPWIIRNSQ